MKKNIDTEKPIEAKKRRLIYLLSRLASKKKPRLIDEYTLYLSAMLKASKGLNYKLLYETLKEKKLTTVELRFFFIIFEIILFNQKLKIKEILGIYNSIYRKSYYNDKNLIERYINNVFTIYADINTNIRTDGKTYIEYTLSEAQQV